MIRRIGSALLASVALTLGACSSDATTGTVAPASPTGGWLTVQLSTPSSNDGAVQLSISGPAIDSVKLVGYEGFSTHTATDANFVATGAIVSGDIARIFVPDLSHTAGYHVTVSAAAARETYALQVIDGYRAVLVR